MTNEEQTKYAPEQMQRYEELHQRLLAFDEMVDEFRPIRDVLLSLLQSNMLVKANSHAVRPYTLPS